VISVKGSVDGVSADREYLLHICYAVFEDQGLPIRGHSLDSAGWCEAVNIAIQKLKIKELLECQG
jgi:hypothetical protein